MARDPSTPISSITQEESEPAVVGPADRPDAEPVPERIRERGEKVGRYVVLDTIGRGGMGVVYSAWDPQLDRRIALKLVALAGEGDVEVETQRARLLREAQALARLEHPNVVKVHDVGVCDEQVFIAMEHVEGVSLRDWLRSRRRSVRSIVEVFRAAAHGLAAAHAAGLVHRDFKPDNVLVGEGGIIKVVDFGLAREAVGDGDAAPRTRHWAQTEPKFAAALEAAASEALASASASDSGAGSPEFDSESFESASSVSPPRSLLRSTTSTLTVAGTILGTPAYMAPEQHRGRVVDARSDQYAFCVALWEAVYGKRPFSGREPKLLAARKYEFKLRESTRGIPVPRWLRALLMKGLAAQPSARFTDMNQLIAALDRGIEPGRSMLPWFALLGIAFVIGIVATVVARDHDDGLCAPPIDRLAGVWDPPRRLEIEQALLASNAVYADDTWTRVREGLDAYREEWLAAMVSACEAVHVEHQQTPQWLEQRLACLEDRRRELVSLTAQLARSDARTVENAARATRSLSPIDTCESEHGDEERMPMPGDPLEQRRVERQLDLLADAKAELAAGHLEEGLSAARGVLDRAREIGWAPLEAEALLVIGDRVHDLERDPAKERATLHEAARAAVRGEHWFLAVQAWSRLARGMARRRELDESKRWLDHATGLARELASTAGESPRLEAELAGTRSQWHFHSGRYAEAEVDARERKDRLVEWYGAESPQVADALNSIGVAVYMQYRKDEAVELYREALAIIERISGPEHPSVAAMHNNIGVVLTDKGRWTEARTHYQRAVAIRRNVYPPGHELLMQSQINLANLYLMCDSPFGGLAVARELVAALVGVTGEGIDEAQRAGASETELAALRVEMVPWLLLLGRTLERSGAHRPALTVLVHALDLVDRAPDTRLPPGTEVAPGKPLPAHLEGCRRDIAVELRDAAEALQSPALAEQAAAIVAGSPIGPDHLQRCAYELESWTRARSE
jgi:serine/threonine protein kinase/tetratricopeptide (TPR) repeat protein